MPTVVRHWRGPVCKLFPSLFQDPTSEVDVDAQEESKKYQRCGVGEHDFHRKDGLKRTTVSYIVHREFSYPREDMLKGHPGESSLFLDLSVCNQR